MGHFLAVSAFRDQNVQSVSEAVIAYSNHFDCECDLLTADEPNDACDALVFPPDNGWTVILWPSYFNIYDIELCRDVSSTLAAIVSTVHVYDGDYWAHALIESGTVRDVFASMPYYFAESPEDAARLTAQWSGNANVFGDVLGVSPDSIAPYFVHLPEDGSPLDRIAFSDDEFPLDDIWVFTDFWRRIGVSYPDPPTNFARILRFNRRFDRKLPSSNEFEL